MSKIGRKHIPLNGATVEIDGQEVRFKGAHNSGVHVIPNELQIQKVGDALAITTQEVSRDINRVWGLHRALLCNKITGAAKGFTQDIIINGLGFKAVVSGQKVEFSLGYSHKIQLELPQGVSMVTDKTGQNLTLKSFNKEMLGKVCSEIRAFRPPEPYKGTGIKLKEEIIIRKAGKARAS